MAQDAVQWYTLKQAAETLGKSKSVLEYHAGKLGAEDRRTDENGVILISQQALEAIRTKLRKTTQQAPDKRTRSTQQAPKQAAQQAPNNGELCTQQAPENALDMLRELNDLRQKLHEAETAAAVAAAERDAERKRADESAAQITSIMAALQTAQQQAADAMAALAASQALQAGQIRLAMQDGEPADGQSREEAVKADPDGTTDQSRTEAAKSEKKRGFLSWFFRK